MAETRVKDGWTYERQEDGRWRRMAPISAGPQPIEVTGADPKLPLEVQRLQQQVAEAQAALARTQATAPYDARKAAADATKAEAEANMAQAKAGAEGSDKERQKQIRADLQADNVLQAIERARSQINRGMTAGNFYGSDTFQKVPFLGQESANLNATLSGIQGSVINDTLAELKALSPTGASGYGSLTENEAQRLAAAVAALQQTQDPQELLNSLSLVDKHYRNAKAILAGEDPRVPEVARKYGVISSADMDGIDRSRSVSEIPGGSGPASPSLTTGDTQTVSDPTLKGLNAEIRKRIGRGDSAGELAAYVDSINPGLGAQMLTRFNSAVQYRKQNPNVPLENYPIDLERRDVPLTTTEQFFNRQAQSPLGAYGIAAGDVASLGTLDNLTDNPAVARAGMSQVAENNPVSSALGTVSGGVLAGLTGEAALARAGLPGGAGLFAPRSVAGDALFGTLYGAGSSDDDRAAGAGLGLFAGVLGGAAGRGALRSAGGAARGVENPEAQYLREQGVRLTPGQMAGGRFKTREDRLAGFQGIGDRINEIRRGGFEDFNQAAFRQGLDPVGGVTTRVGEEGIEQADDIITRSYRQALGGVRGQADDQFITEHAAALDRAAAIPRLGPEVRGNVEQIMSPLFDDAGGLPGRHMQAAVRGLGDVRGGYRNDPLYGQYVAPALDDVEQSIMGMFEREAPDVIPDFLQANTAYRNRRVLGDAVESAVNNNGIFTPAQLGNSARKSARRFGRNADTTERPFFELQRAGQNTLPSTIPDSGTAGRSSSAVVDFARNIANLPIYSDATRPIIERLLLDRPDVALTLGRELQNRARLGGMIGAPLAVQGSGN